jgi:hypothetical protein
MRVSAARMGGASNHTFGVITGRVPGALQSGYRYDLFLLGAARFLLSHEPTRNRVPFAEGVRVQ